MNWLLKALTSTHGKKLLVGLTGVFLITFLVVHATINGMIFFNDHGVMFNDWAHLFGHNVIIRIMEIGLFVALLLHILLSLTLKKISMDARPQGYAYSDYSKNSKWYSRSMALLGTLILIFLVVHLAHFWVKSRFTGLEQYNVDGMNDENLFQAMVAIFQSPLVVLVYIGGCISLFWHLMHGFRSAFQTLGIKHPKYDSLIAGCGMGFSIIISLAFISMPVSMYMGWIS